MNRKEALQILRDMFDYYWAEIKEKRRDEEITEIMEALEQPATLADFLGWEEDVKYEWSGDWYKVKGNTISWFDAKSRVTWIDVTNIYCGVDVDLERLLEFKKNAKKVKPKFKAYHVKNKYSYDYLMKELEKQEYVWFSTGIPKGFDAFEIYRDDTVIFTENNKKMLYGDLEYYNEHENIYELIEYYKEEPLYYAKRKGWEVFESDSEEYWNYCTANGNLITSTKKGLGTIITKMKKEEWNKLGINKENADFEEGESDD